MNFDLKKSIKPHFKQVLQGGLALFYILAYTKTETLTN